MTAERTPRVCVLTSAHKPTSTRIFYKQCRALVRGGYRVTLVAPSDVKHEVRHGVRILGVRKPRSRWERPLIWLSLLRQALALKPDVVHFHDPELLAIMPFVRSALGRDVRIIYDVHEYFVDSIAHKIWIPRSLRGLAGRFGRTAERILGRTVDGLVFVVEEQKEFYTGWRAKRAVVHNYPDPDAFADPQPVPDLPAGRFRLVYIGSIYARRGIMTMLEALAQVVPHAPETLLILGGAFESEAYRQRVHSFIAEHRLEGHVTFLGWVDHARIKDYLAGADVAWLPGLPVKQYRHRAISTKQLECMLMGLPIVSSDHPHRREFIEEAQCGFSVTADDPAAHAEAVLWLYRHPQERRAMGARGRQLVLDKYSWSKEAIVLRAFYEQLLEQES